MTVGIAIPSIPPRHQLLARALTSVLAQTRCPDAIAVSTDYDRQGAAVNRNRAWRQLATDFVAFLDDDDELLPQHLARCVEVAEAEQADMVFPWYELVGPDGGPLADRDCFPASHFTDPWDPADPRQTTITCVWRRTALEQIGGFPEIVEQRAGTDRLGNRDGEDFQAVKALNDAGGKIVHIAERTWRWYWHGSNTSGRNDRW